MNHDKQESGLGSFLWGTLIGGLVGAVAAYLFAPQSGKELREDIEQTAQEARRQIEGERIEDTIQAAKAEARRYRENVAHER